MPRKDLTLAKKIALLDEIRSYPHQSHRRLEKIIGIPRSTIGRLKDKEDKLREEWALREGQQATTQKRKRESKNPDIEKALNQWFSIVSGRGTRVSGPMLKKKSEELAKELGHVDFKATDGWLSRWKSRHDIKFTKANIKKDADVISADEWKLTKLPNLLQKFCADDIYNAEKVDLFYRDTPDGSLCYEQATLSDKLMDSITVLCCSNMSGTDKKKLLVIGKSAKPPCFGGLDLPVHRNVWMLSEIFKRWLMKWDVELHRKSRKVLLVLDNCPPHPNLKCFNNIHLEFLPPNTKSLLHPMNMGLIQHLKTLYHGKLVKYILDAIEENLLTSSSTAKEVSATINLLQAVQFVADSWREISSNTIQNCFALCGFNHHHSSSEMPNRTVIKIESLSEEAIEIKHENTSEDNEDEVDAFAFQRVTKQDAAKFIAGLRRYFMQEGNESSPLSALEICANFVHFQ